MMLEYEKIKAIMGITYDFADDVIKPLIDTTARFCLEAGVPEEVLSSDRAYGLIAMGAKDLYTLGSGDVKFSPIFGMMLTQLSLAEKDGSRV